MILVKPFFGRDRLFLGTRAGANLSELCGGGTPVVGNPPLPFQGATRGRQVKRPSVRCRKASPGKIIGIIGKYWVPPGAANHARSGAAPASTRHKGLSDNRFEIHREI